MIHHSFHIDSFSITKRFTCSILTASFTSTQSSRNGAQHSSEEAQLSHNGAQYSSGEAQLSSEEAQLSKFSSYEVCVLRNCGVSASAQVVEGKTVRVGYHAS